MTVGKKIKFIRTFRKMTQRELGLALGFSEQTADNRIAQYETNYRVPKKELLIKMAEVLNVHQGNFLWEDEQSASNFMMSLFWLDTEALGRINLFSLERKYPPRGEIFENPKVVYDDTDDWPASPPVGMYIGYGPESSFMKEWLMRQEELRAEIITKDEYLEWKLQWPCSCDDCGVREPIKRWRKQ